jgi:hypothetical protein
LPDLLGEGVDSALLLVEVGRAVEGMATECLFKELEERVRPTEVGLVDLPGHRVR